MPKATDPKNCIKCGIALTSENWEWSKRKNHVNKCRDCIRALNRAYQKAWNAANHGVSSANALRYKARLRATDPVKARAKDAYSDCRKRAIKQGMEFDLTPDFVLALMRKAVTCPYFGWALTFAAGKDRTLASIDRIDSVGGYTKNNVRVLSYLANLMKSYATEEELVMFAKGVLLEHDSSLDDRMLGLGAMRSVEKVKGAEGNR